MNKKVLFLGETFRADAQTWIKGLKEYGDFEIISWEIPIYSGKIGRIKRIIKWLGAVNQLKKLVRQQKPDIVLAYRVTSFGYLGAKLGKHPLVVAQQGVTDVWPPNTITTPFKAKLAKYALNQADLIHAWGDVMVPAMIELGANTKKIMVMAKGVDKNVFYFDGSNSDLDSINIIVTRSLSSDYRHKNILNAIHLVKKKGYNIKCYMVGGGPLEQDLKNQTIELELADNIVWLGKIPNTDLGNWLRKCNFYVSTPISEGVSSSLFEAMACGCYPIVTDLIGNRSWINHNDNGKLVGIDNSIQLADELIDVWLNKEHHTRAITYNIGLVKEKATYQTNMPQIVAKYFELIDVA
ncbi:MAG: glycosyltransferase family 4 protein [Bacteroidota bacterium]|nr:glycosyltransferase family 4 protein [Bacteroidota bacterium]